MRERVVRVAAGESQQAQQNWRYCGGQIKLWRESAGVTRQGLADEAGYDYEYVKSMECGRRRPTLRLLQIADQMCGAGGKLTAAHEFMKPERFPERTQQYVLVEAEAITIQWFEPMLIPGLLQTADYARALINSNCPPLDADTVDERVAARLQRQEKLTSKPPTHFSFVIHEAALRSVVGGRELMRGQCAHLLEIGQRRHLSVQVLPFSTAPTAALSGPMVLVETGDHERYAFVDGQSTGALYGEGDKLSTLTQRYGMIRMQALSVEESAQFIRGMAEKP
ncbi:helix-turn-helix transcriptional regulator [Streptomyces jietaisiensis]|uniref:Helix-turn-helix transcriptional regulator n=1 Tax=Streptomyces griseoaurantiacus TaxID=68213 RepID=A0ABZ1V6J5_9ACTN|nr:MULTISPECIES: helix-turn-helix transcriptional regulator [Streptomyces]MDX3090887.1 helix-turn-helix transcriptional regulator [Streptomyces sp. ME12-02E]MDX3333286.1 helix-turn-helix transcriptional regulator [Streptomyces sp. ME02-6978a]